MKLGSFIYEMNGYHFLDKRTQFHFYINSIRKKKRFGGKWLSQAKLKNIEYVKEYYGYSNEKAKSALSILNDEQIKTIMNSLKRKILEKKVKLEIENQKLTELRDWLLPMLMNGQVKVN